MFNVLVLSLFCVLLMCCFHFFKGIHLTMEKNYLADLGTVVLNLLFDFKLILFRWVNVVDPGPGIV